MKAKEHASYCVDIAKDLTRQLEVEPVFDYAINHQGDKIFVYCHPEDSEFLYLKDFKYPHREI